MRIDSPYFHLGLLLAFLCLAVTLLFTKTELALPIVAEDAFVCKRDHAAPQLGPAPAVAPTSKQDDHVYCILPREQMPLFPGCGGEKDYPERKQCSDKKLLEFIYGNLQYPTHLRQNTVVGMVVISFIVEKDGSISSPKVVRDIIGGLGEEARRVVQLMIDQDIRWTPGTLRGEPVRVRFNLPVKIKWE
ncbi:MAG: energy transducer TonB [Bacteroidota bacterium]